MTGDSILIMTYLTKVDVRRELDSILLPSLAQIVVHYLVLPSRYWVVPSIGPTMVCYEGQIYIGHNRDYIGLENPSMTLKISDDSLDDYVGHFHRHSGWIWMVNWGWRRPAKYSLDHVVLYARDHLLPNDTEGYQIFPSSKGWILSDDEGHFYLNQKLLTAVPFRCPHWTSWCIWKNKWIVMVDVHLVVHLYNLETEILISETWSDICHPTTAPTVLEGPNNRVYIAVGKVVFLLEDT